MPFNTIHYSMFIQDALGEKGTINNCKFKMLRKIQIKDIHDKNHYNIINNLLALTSNICAYLRQDMYDA